MRGCAHSWHGKRHTKLPCGKCLAAFSGQSCRKLFSPKRSCAMPHPTMTRTLLARKGRKLFMSIRSFSPRPRETSPIGNVLSGNQSCQEWAFDSLICWQHPCQFLPDDLKSTQGCSHSDIDSGEYDRNELMRRSSSLLCSAV